MDVPSPAAESEAPIDNGLIHGLLLNGQGGATSLTWAEVKRWQPDDGPIWVHLDRSSAQAQRWIKARQTLDPLVCDALLAEETRPRVQVFGEGILVILRGVNLNPGATPDDMISVRLWVESNRVITLRRSRLMAVRSVYENLEADAGPRDTVGLLTAVTQALTDRMGPVITNLDEIIDDLEEEVLENPAGELRRELSQMRRQAISLRRHIGPQRDAISHLQTINLPWFALRYRADLREVGERITRIVEDLDAMRERSAIVQEELTGRLNEQMNHTMFILSAVAGIFLPLGLITGLFGINVGGMPGIENPWAFTYVCVSLVVLAAGGFVLFRKMRLF